MAVSLAGPSPNGAVRERIRLDENWRFHLGDDWPGAIRLDQINVGAGPLNEWFDDKDWRSVELPHDWAVELPFDRKADANHGFKPIGTGYPQNSIGWYRRAFSLPKSDSGKRIWLTFDGAFRDTTVWLNGWLIMRHEGGYDPFRQDITDYVRFGDTNKLVVRVDATRFEGWFYEGAGIYRHVWLDKTAPVAVAPDGIFVYTKFKGNVPTQAGAVCVQTGVLNSSLSSAHAELNFKVFSPTGRLVTTFHGSASIPARSQAIVSISAALRHPVLWSPESPSLYRLSTDVVIDEKVTDHVESSFGVRTVAFDPRIGFLLNGKRYEIHGTCNHQDHAGVGVALPDALQDFRVRRLKEFGCNALRTSHNPPTPELLAACDRLGMLVMDEIRLPGSSAQNMAKWTEQICRDRSHPCVAMWSIGNEERAIEDMPQAANVAMTMQAEAHRLDQTRLVTYAAPEGNVFKGINSVIDVRGWNYNVGPEMDAYHAQHPAQPEIGSEESSVVGTRGIYENQYQKGYVSAFDDVWPGWHDTAESWWSYFAARPWLSGAFAWTGFDYRGEPTPYQWPCISSHFGILDTCGFAKDAAYYYKSWWTKAPVVHLLPHWNWPGKEGQLVRVDVYSNCKTVELFLNGNSLGPKTMKPNSKLTWQVKYVPGTLRAIGFDEHGKKVSETSVATTGKPARIRLIPDRSEVTADGADASVFTVSAVDEQGQTVPTASNRIDFTIEGDGKIIGVGNGDPVCHEPDTFVTEKTPHWSRSLFNGLAEVIIQSTHHGGTIRLTAKGDGLSPAEATVRTVSVKRQ